MGRYADQEQTTLSRGVYVCVRVCKPSVPVPRYSTSVQSYLADLGCRCRTVVPPPSPVEQEHLEVRAILVPGSHPCLARLLAWVQHCVRLAATINPLGWVLAARKMLMGTSCPIPLLVDVPPPTPTPCSLLACKYLPLLSSPPPLPPLAIRHSFILPLSRTSPSKPPSPFLDNAQKRREGNQYPLGCIDIRTQLLL